MLNDIVAGIKFLNIHYRHRQPLTKESRPHRRRAFVNGPEKGGSLRAGGRSEDLEVSHGESVHPDEFSFINPADRADILKTRMLGLLQIDHQGSCGANAEREGVDCETLETLNIQLLAELYDSRIVDESPLVNRGRIEVPETLFDPFLIASLDHQLPRVERGKKGCDIIKGPLGQ